MSVGEKGCSFGAMILHDDGLEITEDNLNKLLKAANVECDSYWPGLFAKALGGQDMNVLVTTVGGGGGGGGGDCGDGAGGDGGGDAKKESSEEEEEMAPAANLF